MGKKDLYDSIVNIQKRAPAIAALKTRHSYENGLFFKAAINESLGARKLKEGGQNAKDPKRCQQQSAR